MYCKSQWMVRLHYIQHSAFSSREAMILADASSPEDGNRKPMDSFVRCCFADFLLPKTTLKCVLRMNK